MTYMSVAHLLRARDFAGAVTRMQELSRLSDPTEPVDVEAVRARYEERRTQLRSVVEPEPFRIVVEVVGGKR